jgi:hypothetical protein
MLNAVPQPGRKWWQDLHCAGQRGVQEHDVPTSLSKLPNIKGPAAAQVAATLGHPPRQLCELPPPHVTGKFAE